VATASLTKNPDRFTRFKVALIFARAGDARQAHDLAETLNRELPVFAQGQNYYLPTIRAAIEMSGNKPERAIEILQPTLPYELITGGESENEFEELYPAYVRGLAYLRSGKGREAAGEFQKLIKYRGIVGADVKGALAHLQLGRAQAMMGDKAAARKSYQDFLTLWKDADPDIPIYQQAKAEYAKLQ
jgi:tetratricopeptide (TPR) repeat protein